MKITIIGAGNMGGALARGWAKSEQVGAKNITVSDLNQTTLDKIKSEFPDITVTNNNSEAVRGADIVVCAVKPWLVEPVVNGFKDVLDYSHQVVVSIAAGVMSEKLTTLFQREDGCVPPLFYVIPNIAAGFCQSMSFVSAAKGVDKATQENVRELFAAVGDSLRGGALGQSRDDDGLLWHSPCDALYSCYAGRRCGDGILSFRGIENRHADDARSGEPLERNRHAS